MFTGYTQFAQRVRFADFAVGLVMGGAFFAAVASVFGDVVMPAVGWGLTGSDFRELFIALDGTTYATLKAARDAGAPVIAWGLSLISVINVGAVALAVHVTLRIVNRFA